MRIGGDALRLSVAFILGADGVFERNWADALKDFDLFVAHCVGVEAAGRLHGDQRQQLEEVILEHVAQHARGIVISRAVTDIHAFRHRDLHVADVAAVPNGFEDGIGKAEEQDVLRGFLAEIMVNAVNLAFVEGGMQDAVEFVGRGEVAPKRFFDHDSPPDPVGFLMRHARRVEMLGNRAVVFGGCRQVVESVGGARFQVPQERVQAGVIVWAVEIPLEIMNPFGELIPNSSVKSIGAELGNALPQVGAEGFAAILAAGKADDVGAFREPSLFEVVVQGRDEFAVG